VHFPKRTSWNTSLRHKIGEIYTFIPNWFSPGVMSRSQEEANREFSMARIVRHKQMNKEE
jgi:hypothetical protein